MQKLDDGRIIFSASDLTSAADCEWALVRKLDKLLGHDILVPESDDPMMKRAGELGDVHERNKLDALKSEFPWGVVSFERPTYDDPQNPWLEQMQAVTAATLESLRAKTPVVFQGAFFDGSFQGFADFLILNAEGEYEVNDTKLARKAKITALIQLAAYAEQLRKNNIPTSNKVHLLLGDGKVSSHDLRDILPVFVKRRDRLVEMIEERSARRSRGEEPSPWNDPQYAACGKCAVCEPQVTLFDDVLQVAGLRHSQRAKLRAAGIETMAQLAGSSSTPVPGIPDRTLSGLQAQAKLQVETRESASPEIPVYRLYNPAALSAIPAPSPGDIFFDFEGDPLYQEGQIWNLDYLFGFVDDRAVFEPLWAHNHAEEKHALIRFLDIVRERRAQYPDMHIYHYAAYERTHLLMLAARYGVGEAFVDELLVDHVLVDLYPIVKRSMRVGSYSYSLKKLEPLYMRDDEREGVATAADSVVEYANYCQLVAEGRTAEAEAKLADIARYNAYDCRSTLALRDWLRGLAQKNQIVPLPPQAVEIAEAKEETDPLYESLMSLIDDVPLAERTADHTAVALTAAAIDFHRRENKSYWWAHYNRLESPIEDWEDTKDVFIIDRHEVVVDWHTATARQKKQRRHVLLQTTPGPGSRLTADATVFMVYPSDAESIPESSNPAAMRTVQVKVLEVLSESEFLVEETQREGGPNHDHTPVALTPGTPPETKKLAAAITEWGTELLSSYPRMPENASMDILRRIAPRGAPLTSITGDETYKIVRDSLLSQDDSYVAVQGPPGAGKSYNGGHVIADLVNIHGWKVGVVGQSHATVENLLRSVNKAGVPKGSIAKAPRTGVKAHEVADLPDTKWTSIEKDKIASFLATPGGAVVGGTAWDFANTDRVERRQLDLLVIDEAGQYSLANTIAASVSAKRLLLLGDPQQLPQVTQGTHPEPIDGSALGWLTADSEVIPDDLGYFLDKSWRMRPEVCAVVSELSYDGMLTSHPSDRFLEGVDPGFYPMPVFHLDNSTDSPEEAKVVVELVQSMLSKTWNDGTRIQPLGDADENIIVVAPYNAQVNLIRNALDKVGLEDIRVGTVDKFQGQQAAVAIVSLAASSANDVPRGIEFLLMQNRLNVAISRAKWAAYLIYSPELTEFLPTNVRDLKLLSKFITLTGQGHGHGHGNA